MPNDNIIWDPEAYYENGQWHGGWRLSQEAADKRDREYLEEQGEKDANTRTINKRNL